MSDEIEYEIFDFISFEDLFEKLLEAYDDTQRFKRVILTAVKLNGPIVGRVVLF